MRSCYSSTWRLFEGSTIETPGRYVFAPADTPFYPGWHLYGSRDWTNDEGFREDVIRGDVGVHTYYDGRPPVPFPLPIDLERLNPARHGGPDACRPPNITWSIVDDFKRSLSVSPDLSTYVTLAGPDCGGTGDGSAVAMVRFRFRTTQTNRLTMRVSGTIANAGGSSPATTASLPGFGTVGLSAPGTGGPCSTFSGAEELTKDLAPGDYTCTVTFSDGVVGGSAAGVMNFELLKDPPFYIPPFTYRNGFDVRCYGEGQPGFFPDYQNRTHAAELAAVIADLYVDADAAQVRLNAFLGPGWTFEVDPTTAMLGSGTIAASSLQGVVILQTGTLNYQQLAFQALYGIVGTRDFTSYSANAYQYHASDLLQNKIFNWGIDPDKRILMVGHSLGAAMVYLLGARYGFHKPTRLIEYLGFGVPRCGDRRLYEILNTKPMRSYANLGDPVPCLPPLNGEFASFYFLFPLPNWLAWNTYWRLPAQFQIDRDGVISADWESYISVAAATAIMTRAVNGDPQVFQADHEIAEYARRLALNP